MARSSQRGKPFFSMGVGPFGFILRCFACCLASTGATAARGADASPVFDVPRVDHITIDGSGDEWGDRGFRVSVLANTAEHLKPREDFDGDFRLGWDERGLLVLVHVRDNLDVEADDPTSGGDSVDLFISSSPPAQSADVVRVVVGPGCSTEFQKLRARVVDLRTNPQLRKVPPTAVASRTRVAGGYVLEVLMPWENLGIRPAVGREIAFQLQITDSNGTGGTSKLLWYPGVCSAKDKTKMYRVRLADAPSPPVRASAYGNYVRLHRTRIIVLAEGELAGKSVEVLRGKQVLANAKLHADFVQEGRAAANVSLPIPPRGQPYGTLTVKVDGRFVADLDFPDLGDMSKWVVPYAEVVFKPCVFSGRAFPEADFDDPTLVEDVIGPYEIKTTFYDADYNRVETAEKPGRYGAIVEIQTEDGQSFKRFRTLFREPKDVSWRNADMPVTLTLPKEMGISPAVLKDQSKTISEFFKQLIGDEALFHDPNTAVLLAGLYETKIDVKGDAKVDGKVDPTPGLLSTVRNLPLVRDQQWWAGLKRKTGDLKLPYLVQLPADYVKDPNKKWPLILYLHGKGERGEDLEQVRGVGLAAHRQYDPTLPFIIISPQCAWGEWWSPWELNALLDEVGAKYPVDADRVYLTGNSMGGYGTWAMAEAFPQRFAAIAPICGGGDAAEAERLRGLAVWAFHGTKDSVVPFWESDRMVHALRAVGADVKFTVYSGVDHDCWTQTYANDRLYAWFLQHSRHGSAGVPAGVPVPTPAAVAVPGPVTTAERGVRVAKGSK